ncbi:MAG TPA: cell wall-active antibiotics response protein [Firmicutes bacterium]|nr:cell wall-active antibiotics response protein [Bacillota bacterium]
MRFISMRLILGLFLLLVGVATVLGLFGLEISAGKVWSYWPVIPLLIGINWMILSFPSSTDHPEQGKKTSFLGGRFVAGLFFFAIGIFYLGRKFGYFLTFNTGMIWRILFSFFIILVGYELIRGSISSQGRGRWAIMGGVKVGGGAPWKLESGSYFAFMGGIEIDLTAAELPAGETVLDLTAVMGGIEVKVPENLSVVGESSVVLGGVTFKDQEDGGIIAGSKYERYASGSPGKVLRVQARAILGGIDIKEGA